VTYTIPDGWVNVSDWPDYFMLIPDTPANRAAAASDEGSGTSILILTGGTDSSSRVGCDQPPPASPVAISPSEFADAIARREGLHVVGTAAVSVGGLDGRQVDVMLAEGWTGTCPDDPTTPSEQLWPGVPVYAGESHRLVVLDTGGGTVIVHLLAPTPDFEPFVTAAMPIVESFEFDLVP
jgi:hypothetical protein